SESSTKCWKTHHMRRLSDGAMTEIASWCWSARSSPSPSSPSTSSTATSPASCASSTNTTSTRSARTTRRPANRPTAPV
ncbi:hypothetical protein LOY98_006896, partial [Ophidiomyces ophidiicola]